MAVGEGVTRGLANDPLCGYKRGKEALRARSKHVRSRGLGRNREPHQAPHGPARSTGAPTVEAPQAFLEHETWPYLARKSPR